MDSILIVEDNDSLREVLCTVLAYEGYQVTSAPHAEAALELIQAQEFSLILSDLKLPQMNGLDFLVRVKEIGRSIPFIVMTAYGSIDIAVRAIKLGATDFITKPFDPDVLCQLISQISEHRRIVDRSFGNRRKTWRSIITQSPNMEEVLHQARKVAVLSTPVLIVGESGTGKELLARYIHEQSPRAAREFYAVNCASLPAELLESEFFGHEAGAFTGATERRLGLFEVASQSSLFLDEIGNMPPHLQIKLLRTLQESEVKRIGATQIRHINTRVISATNCDIDTALKTGRMREDLYYRLSVVLLELPPLRQRRQDIPLLANYFLKSFSADSPLGSRIITPDAMDLLLSHDWPGNVRELENVMERAVIFSQGPITAQKIELNGSKAETSEECQSLPEIAARATRDAEATAIRRALFESHGNKAKAARCLGVSYKTLLNKIKDYHLAP